MLHELYDILSFDLAIDYRSAAVRLLTGVDAKWAEVLLCEKWLRT